jgi:outer membrane cobalamin receptor
MRRTTFLLLATILATGATRTWAQTLALEDLAQATLEELLNVKITTASRTSEEMSRAAARVSVITGAQIQRRGYRSLSDVLKDLPDFKVDLFGDPDNPAQLTIDGSRGTDRVVVLLDGVRISSPTNEPLPILANYPVHSARQIEVLYGPASALYGADAFSSVINIISKSVDDAPGATLSTAFGQFGLYSQTGLYSARLGSKASLMVAAQGVYDAQPDLSKYYPEDFGGLVAQHTGVFNTIFGPMTPNRPVSPDYDIPMSAHSAQASLRAGGLQAVLFQSHSRVSTTPASRPDNGVYNRDAFNLNELLVGSASYTRPIGRVTSTTAATFSRHELDPQSGYWNVYSNLEKSYKYAYGSMAKMEEQLSWKLSPSIAMTTGGTYERFFAIPQGADLNRPVMSHDVSGTILDTAIPDVFNKVRYSNTGAFAQGQYSVSPAITLTVGARGDYNTRYGGTFNPRVGLVGQTSHGTTLKLLYGTAYLAPSPYQSFAHYGSFYSTDGGQTYASSYWHVPNPELKPQRKKTVEFNALQSLGSDLHMSAAAFYSAFSETIKDADPDRAYSGTYLGWPVDYIDFAVNEGRARTYGGSVGLDYVRVLGADRRIEGHASLVYTEGRVWDEDDSPALPIGAMAPLQMRFGADVDWHQWSVAPRFAIVGAQRLIATMDAPSADKRRTLDGFTKLDLNLRRNRLFKNVGAFLTVENAFDVRYRTINAHSYLNPEELVGSPQNPRRLTVGFDVRFH